MYLSWKSSRWVWMHFTRYQRKNHLARIQKIRCNIQTHTHTCVCTLLINSNCHIAANRFVERQCGNIIMDECLIAKIYRFGFVRAQIDVHQPSDVICSAIFHSNPKRKTMQIFEIKFSSADCSNSFVSLRKRINNNRYIKSTSGFCILLCQCNTFRLKNSLLFGLWNLRCHLLHHNVRKRDFTLIRSNISVHIAIAFRVCLLSCLCPDQMECQVVWYTGYHCTKNNKIRKIQIPFDFAWKKIRKPKKFF